VKNPVVPWAILDQRIRQLEEGKPRLTKFKESKIAYKDGAVHIRGLLFTRAEYNPDKEALVYVGPEGLRIGSVWVLPDPRLKMKLKKWPKTLKAFSDCTLLGDGDLEKGKKKRGLGISPVHLAAVSKKLPGLRWTHKKKK